MHRITRLAAALAVAAAVLAGSEPARAQDKPLLLSIGTVPLMLIRTGDHLNGRDWSINDRIANVHEAFAKHLGAKYGKFTWKKIGNRVHIYLNNDFVLAVTPADAQATGYKTADALAPGWVDLLKKAFTATHHGNTGGAR